MSRGAQRTLLWLAAAGLVALLGAAWPLDRALFAAPQASPEPAPMGSLPSAWAHWRYFRAIEIPPTSEPRLAALLVPQEVYDHAAAGLADLRIIDDRGDAAPYATITLRGTVRTETRAIHHLERSSVPGKYLQLLIDLGPTPPPHNGLRIQTSATEYIGWAEVALSDNGRDWRSVPGRAPLFRFETKHVPGRSLVSYPETRARFLRLRIARRGDGFPVEGVTVFDQTKSPADRAVVAARFAPGKQSAPGTFSWQADLGAALPLDEVDFETTQPEFSRRVEVLAADQQNAWTPCGDGDIYRIRREDQQQE
jgi:hypothetical protein